jgi:hypothetical protein
VTDNLTAVLPYLSLVALIDDGYDVQPAYVQDPPLLADHPAIAYADRQLAAGFPIAPKVAEGIFLQVPNEESCQAASQRYTGTEHMAGSGFDQISAFRLKEEYERLLGIPVTGPFENLFEAGSSESQAMVRDTQTRPQVWIDTYFPVLNKPVDREVSILRAGSSDAAWSAKLREDIVEGDEFSKLRDEVPVFHGLSKSGDVTAQVVFAGYGRKSDFDALEKAGIEVAGKIALVKYVFNCCFPFRALRTDGSAPALRQVRRRLSRSEGKQASRWRASSGQSLTPIILIR